ncbi:hypothetical protein MMPV_002417 [Pyropia vietnamensis]
MPPRIWMPNVRMRLKLRPAPSDAGRVRMPEAGTEGTFRTQTLVVETPPQLTKVEAKMLLSSIYGMHIDQVASLNMMGGRQRIAFKEGDNRGTVKKDKDMKRFYVKLSSAVDVPTVPKQSLLPGWTDASKGDAK